MPVRGLTSTTQLSSDGIRRRWINFRSGAGGLAARFRQPGEAPTFLLSRWLFLRLLGVICLCAFVSLWTQIDGLIGSEGIVPATEQIASAKQHLSGVAFLKLPTLCWLSAGDTFLNGLCAAGTLLSLLLIGGVAPIPVLVLTWLAYLSVAVVGSTFLNFQWDALLLETVFLAVFVAPANFSPRVSRERSPRPAGLWLLRWLLFKLMFLSGITKLLSGDPSWRQLTALSVHYETQPLPTWIGWYAHQLPSWFGEVSLISMFVIELAAPFLIFAPRWLRHPAAGALIVLQIIIAATGNYCFFNLLTIALCVLLLDDRFLRRLVPRRFSKWTDKSHAPGHTHRLKRLAGAVLVALLMLISGLTFVREMVRSRRPSQLPAGVVTALSLAEQGLLAWGQPYVLRFTDPFRTISGYGLFRVMTTRRPEIIIEGSHDGRNWQAYSFKWKPGDLKRRPRFVAPHQPRLDWQMWFAALRLEARVQPPWIARLLQRLLEGQSAVNSLFEHNPFPDRPPRFVRLALYHYHFTDSATRRQTGAWWRREYRGRTRPLGKE